MFSRMLCFGLARALSLARSLSLFPLWSLSFPLPSCSVTVHGLVAKRDRDIVYSTLVGSGAVRDLEIAFQVCKHANRLFVKIEETHSCAHMLIRMTGTSTNAIARGSWHQKDCGLRKQLVSFGSEDFKQLLRNCGTGCVSLCESRMP
jgi:hypothetical protein